MTRLEVWLKFKGKKIEENLWSLPNYPRVDELLDIWGGTFSLQSPDSKAKSKIYILDYTFDGELYSEDQTGTVADSITDELNRIANARRHDHDKDEVHGTKNIRPLISRWLHNCQSEREQLFVIMNF